MRPSSRLLIPLLLWLTASQAVAASSAGPGAQSTGRITGHVTEAGGAPAAGVSVDAYVRDATGNREWVTQAVTDAAGNYALTDLSAGEYFVVAAESDPIRVAQVYPNISCLGCDPVAIGSAIVVTGGGTAAGIDFALQQPGHVAGTVRSVTGEPLLGVRVEVYLPTDGTTAVAYAVTDTFGAYSTAGLPAGTYYLRTSNFAGYLEQAWDAVSCFGCNPSAKGNPVAVAAGAVTGGVDFYLEPGGRISGTVLDAATSGAISDAFVHVYVVGGAGVSYVSSARTDASGAYELTGLPDGSYYVQVVDPGDYVDEVYNNVPCVGCNPAIGTAVQVRAGTTAANVNFQLAPGGAITGFVIDEATGQPVSDVVIEMADASGAFSAYGWTDWTGAYTIAGLPAGTFYLRTWNMGGYVDELYGGTTCVDCGGRGTPVSVTAGQATADVNFALGAGGRIAGTVREATGAELADVLVGFFTADGSPVGTATSQWDGTYLSDRALPPGTYYARVTEFDPRYVGQIFNARNCAADCASAVVTGDGIVVTAGATTWNVDFALVVGGSVAGRVSDATSGAAIAATVHVADAARRVIATGATDFLGRYRVTGLPAGTYYVFTGNEIGYVNEIYDERTCLVEVCSFENATPVSVTLGATTGSIDFGLQRGARIGGSIVRASNGDPVGGMTVRIFDDTGRVVGTGTSDAFGRFVSSEGLPQGTYFARTSPSPVFRLQQYMGQTCANDACDAASGTSIPVSGTTTANGLDFALSTCSAAIVASGSAALEVPRGVAYTESLAVSGGNAPFSFKRDPSSGPLPPGLALSASGVISGTATTVGSWPVSVWAVDASGCSGLTTYRMVVKQVALPPTIGVGATAIGAGETVTATIANGPGYPGDWVGLFPVGGANGTRIASQFLNGLGTMPPAGLTSATLTFRMPTAAGAYEFRLFRNNTWTLLATSPSITVIVPALGVTPTSAQPGQTLTVTVANGPGYPGDWIGLFPVGGGNATRLASKFLNGSGTLPATGLTDATVTFSAPLTSGSYEFRLFRNNSWTLLATSPAVTIVAPTVNINPTSAQTRSTVTVTVANGPGNPGDWVGLFPVGGTNAQRVSSQFLNGTQTPPPSGLTEATLIFTLPKTPGAFEFRLFRNNSWTRLATSPPLTITVPPLRISTTQAVAGATISVTVQDGPGNPGDWVGLFPVGGTNDQRIASKFLNGTMTLPATGLTDATLTFTLPMTAGTYEFRLFRNNSWTLLASSPAVTVFTPTVTPSTGSAAPGESITVTVTDGPGNPGDWVGLFPVGGTNAQRLASQFLNGTLTPPPTGLSAATLTFRLPTTPGSYEFRLFRNNTWTLLATSAGVTVASTSAQP